MGNNKQSTGIEFKYNPNTVEYQYFPEEYFSGSDVTVYFGDLFVSDISGIEFTLEEKVIPIYGYASNTWDYNARGNRLVRGSFKIPFKEAGYLDAILSHIAKADVNSKNKIGYLLAGEKPPKWVAEPKESIEQWYEKHKIAYKEKKVRIDNEIFKNREPVKPGDYGDHIKEIRRLMVKAEGNPKNPHRVFEGKTSEVFIQSNNKLRNFIKQRYGAINYNTCKQFSNDMGQRNLNGGEPFLKGNIFVEYFQSRLNHIINYIMSDKSMTQDGGVLGDGKFGHITTKKAIIMCERFKVNRANGNATAGILKASRDANIAKDMVATGKDKNGKDLHLGHHRNETSTDKPSEMIGELVCLHPNEDDYFRYAVDMYEWLRKWQDKWHKPKLKGEERGILRKEDLIQLYKDAGEDYYRYKTEWEKVLVPSTIIDLEDRESDYEREVWGRNFSHDDNHKFQHFFYTDRKGETGTNLQEKLKTIGFDIYITYGPIGETLNNNENIIKTDKLFPFNTTVKTICNVQLTSTGQTIYADGRPVEEIYTFIAKDLD